MGLSKARVALLVAAGLGGALVPSCAPDGSYATCGVLGGPCCGSGPKCRQGLTCEAESCKIVLTDASLPHLDASTKEAAPPPECTPGSSRCSGDMVQPCTAQGFWGAVATCATGACADAACAGSTTEASSCAADGGGLACGAGGAASCCESAEVPGGAFYRGYDGVSPGATSKSAPASVSGLRLDRFEVTVGRFRRFVSAVVGGYAPPQGSGVHVALNDGRGLADAKGGFEPGWDGSWSANLATTAAAWNTALACDASFSTWTPAPGAAESLPVNCVSWYEAYAFCIWDGGYLPTEAEWNYAAAGGSQQRVYPWSTPASSNGIDCSQANYSGGGACGGAFEAVGKTSPAGDGRWGQADLAGNVWEWTLDWVVGSGSFPIPCVDCASASQPSGSSQRVIHGGALVDDASRVTASSRAAQAPSARSDTVGMRCARRP